MFNNKTAMMFYYANGVVQRWKLQNKILLYEKIKKKKDKPTTQIVTQLNVLFIKCCNEFKFICCGL